jgi:hypothetical protein
MSRFLLWGTAELESEVDEPLDLLRVEPASEARHRTFALGNLVANRRAVTVADQGRGAEVEVGIEAQTARVSLAAFAMAAGAVAPIELRGGEVLAGAAGEPRQRPKQKEQEKRPELQVRGLAESRRCT